MPWWWSIRMTETCRHKTNKLYIYILTVHLLLLHTWTKFVSIHGKEHVKLAINLFSVRYELPNNFDPWSSYSCSTACHCVDVTWQSWLYPESSPAERKTHRVQFFTKTSTFPLPRGFQTFVFIRFNILLRYAVVQSIVTQAIQTDDNDDNNKHFS